MDNQPNVVETQSTTPPMPTSPTPKPKSNGLLVVITVILFIIILGLLTYIAYQKNYIQLPFLSKQNTDTNTNSQTQTETGSTTEASKDVKFAGTVVTATLPEGWSMKEYFNGQGSEYLVEGVTYTGLTGIKIFNADNTDVFHLSAVNGIGFEGCSEYYLSLIHI
jgi:cytoskeletal protein RodZ